MCIPGWSTWREEQMKIGGWTRLWIVVSALYFCIVVIFSISKFPVSTKIKHEKEFYEKLPPEFRKLVDPLSVKGGPTDLFHALDISGYVERVEMPNGHVLIFTLDTPKAQQQDVVHAYLNIVDAAASQRQKKFLTRAALIWGAPVAFLFIFGWSVGWVRDGFQKRRGDSNA
jgi:hypothetical protein